jgi:hypothetical protein
LRLSKSVGKQRGHNQPLACEFNGRQAARVRQIELARQHLHDADDVPGLLAAGWEIFELVRIVAAEGAGQAADMYPAFTFARGSAVSGLNAIALAPSMPTGPAARSDSSAQLADDVYEIADAIASLAGALSTRLREAAGLAADSDDRAACENAAGDAEKISGLLAKGV